MARTGTAKQSEVAKESDIQLPPIQPLAIDATRSVADPNILQSQREPSEADIKAGLAIFEQHKPHLQTSNNPTL
jgi:hypothetical protein